MNNIPGIVAVIAVLLLQVYLSRCVSRWPGLVLPILTGLFSLVYPLSFAVPPGGMVTPQIIWQLLMIVVIANIPTAILLVIYFNGRREPRTKRQMDKMNAQDLD